MEIRKIRPADLPEMISIWNGCADRGEVLCAPMTEDRFRRTFLQGPGRDAENLLAAEEEGRLAGFLQGVAPGAFPGARTDTAFLTVLMTDPDLRGRGIGKGMLEAFGRRMACLGAKTLSISSLNPVSLTWRIPGTPGHDHNNMPGADALCAGYSFLEHCGFVSRYREIAMYADLARWEKNPAMEEIRRRLRQEGIETGICDASRAWEYDGMCDRVGSEYWRDVLRTELAAWKAGTPNGDARMWPDGKKPRGPRPLLTATREGQIIGFTGPVDLQESGRGWFTGICTDPLWAHRGIATVLFQLLLEAFVQEGARFTSLFTGTDNPARMIYERAGLRPVREFRVMSAPL